MLFFNNYLLKTALPSFISMPQVYDFKIWQPGYCQIPANIKQIY